MQEKIAKECIKCPLYTDAMLEEDDILTKDNHPYNLEENKNYLPLIDLYLDKKIGESYPCEKDCSDCVHCVHSNNEYEFGSECDIIDGIMRDVSDAEQRLKKRNKKQKAYFDAIDVLALKNNEEWDE